MTTLEALRGMERALEPCNKAEHARCAECELAKAQALAAWRSRTPLVGDEALVEAVARALEVGECVTCAVCGRQKQPRGRSAALEAASGYCSYECDGYAREPHVGSLWPGESRIDFGFPAEHLAILRKAARAALAALDSLLASPTETKEKP